MRAGVAAVHDPRAQAHLVVGMGAWWTANWMGRLPLGKVTDGPNGYGQVEAESWESPEQDRLRGVLFRGVRPGGTPLSGSVAA